MNSTLFVGRDEELNDLTELLAPASAGSGSVVFLDGPPGVGKTKLVETFFRNAKARNLCSDSQLAVGYCYEQSGSTSAYQPLIEILEAITGKCTVRSKKGILKKIVSETASDWLQAIPVFGSAIDASYKTAKLTNELLLKGEASGQHFESMSSQYVSVIERISQENGLLVLVIEDAHWIDKASCELVRRIIPKLRTLNVVLIITYRSTDLDADHPIHIASLEAISRNLAHAVHLETLSRAQVAEYVNRRFLTDVPTELVGWLMHLSSGHPMFVEQYLSLLEVEEVARVEDGSFRLDGEIEFRDSEWKVSGRLAEMPVPESVEALVEQRLSRLLEEEQQLLELGAVQGTKFLSIVLARLLDSRERDVLVKLRRVCERHKMISVDSSDDWLRNKSEIYAFEHALLHNALYNRLTPRERTLYHQEVARILQQTWDDEESTPRKILIDIAHHYEHGQILDKAAKFYFLAAKSCYSHGALEECSKLSESAMEALERLPRDPQLFELSINTALLNLLASRGSGDRKNRERRRSIAETAEELAEETGNRTALSTLKSLHGHLLIGLGDTEKGIDLLRNGLEIAEDLNDPVTRCFSMLQLGSQLAKVDLRESLLLRRRALEVYEEELATTADIYNSVDIRRYFNQLLVYIGVGEFDIGDFGAAERYLRKGIDGLLEMHMHNDLHQAYNYLGQLLLATGRYRECKAAISASIELENGKSDLHPWVACNIALLGKTYLDKGKTKKARKLLEEGLRISEEINQEDLVSLVRNQYAEMMILEADDVFDAETTREVLDRSIKTSRRSGLLRSEVLALSLKGLFHLRLNELDDARRFSEEAVKLTGERGLMPALRLEEILFNHSRVLAANGESEEAQKYVNASLEEINRKLESIDDEKHRKSFLKRVPLNRAIIAAARSQQKNSTS